MLYIHITQIIKKIKIKVMSKKKTVVAPVETIVVNSVKRGRPTLEGSARQAKLAARAERVAAGGSVERGRPSNPDSARQARLAARAARLASGVEVKAGRPKGTGKTVEVEMSVEPVVEVSVEVEA
jgi:hypothetical protein